MESARIRITTDEKKNGRLWSEVKGKLEVKD
jgi:hypothetical protein